MSDTTTITIDRDRALDLLNQAITQRGSDYVYERPDDGLTCFYWHQEGDTPGCIVGLALHLAGVERETLRKADTIPPRGASHSGTTIASVVARGVLANDGVTLTPGAVSLLNQVQARQDDNETWGDAVKHGVRDSEGV
jgi:hypothetical protein